MAYRTTVDEFYSYCAEYGHPPTVRELGLRCGYTSTSTTMSHLDKAVKRGEIAHEPNRVPAFYPIPERRNAMAWAVLDLAWNSHPDVVRAWVQGKLELGK
jgi:SOS-response transcriptional repressor LexA